MNDLTLIHLLQPGINQHIPGARLLFDLSTDSVVVERNGERRHLLSRSEIEDGSYKEKFAHRVLAMREDK